MDSSLPRPSASRPPSPHSISREASLSKAERRPRASSSRQSLDDYNAPSAPAHHQADLAREVRSYKRSSDVDHTRVNGKGKGKSTSASTHLNPQSRSSAMHKSTSGVRVSPEEYCSFCGGTSESNKIGVKERMLSCGRCGRSGHPTCLNLVTSRLKHNVMTYDWCCLECKTCEVCLVKGDDVSGGGETGG